MQGRKNKLALLNSFTQFQHDTSLHLSISTLLPIYDAVIRPAMLTFKPLPPLLIPPLSIYRADRLES
jgi:hypothetical protein